ncbi:MULTISPECIES: restriction endonuclease [Paenibacillus]|uniref:restriction endonuclease n=1 Tax=Paenibacillus TaxID=44249 RepID=UPI000ADC8CE3|nr:MULTISPECIES: restriction endonuclease [Paenibacillus]
MLSKSAATRVHYGASEAWVVSISDYTATAYDLAKSNRVLKGLILRLQQLSQMPAY